MNVSVGNVSLGNGSGALNSKHMTTNNCSYRPSQGQGATKWGTPSESKTYDGLSDGGDG